MPTHDHSPDRPSELSAEGIPDLETPINEFEGMLPPRDYPQGATEFGVTPEEERQQEPLAERVLREEPDVLPGDDGAAGRLVQPDLGVVGADVEATEVAGDVGPDDGGFSAEEAAMHITDSP